MVLKKLINKLKDIKNKSIVVMSDSTDYNQILSTILTKLKDKKVLYVSLNKPNFVIKKLTKNKNIFFIDAVSKKEDCFENCIHIRSPKSLSELSVAISSTLSKEKYDILIFDSVSTLSLYSTPELTEKFIHFQINKLRYIKVGSIFLMIKDDESEEMFKIISQSVDESIIL